MKIQLQEKLLNKFPNIKVGILFLEGMQNGGNSDISFQLLIKTIEKIKREGKELEEDAWVQAFKEAGIKEDVTPSHFTLLKRILESTNTLPNISNAVNAINKIQLIHKNPIGIHDVDKIEGDVVIGFNEKELSFLPRENDQTQDISADEIVYADDSNVLTRNWANKQGRKSLIDENSRNAFVVVDTLDLTETQINEILLDLADHFNQFIKPKKISHGILSSKDNNLELSELPTISKFKNVNIDGCRSVSRDPKIIERIITKGVEDILPNKDRLLELLNSGKRLRIYQGFDPTAPTLHIGHTVMMRKLEDFRRLGHEVFMLIGDFTGRIGDPTDKSSARVTLSEDQVIANLKLYKEQASSLISINDKDNPVTVVFNNDWLGKLSFAQVVDIASDFTVQQMMKRDMFQRRLEEDKPIYLHEFLYPLMQGFDSLALNVDIELGGNDQMFNMLAGRTLLEKRAKKDKIVMNGKLLTTSEGKKMGKSEGNMIMLSDTPENIFGKVMAFTDAQIVPGFELLTNMEMEDVEQIEREIKTGSNPMVFKKQLAFTIVSELKGEESAKKAQQYFEGIFQKQNSDVQLEEVKVSNSSLNILDLMIEAGMSKSKSDARRLVEQGAVYINDKKVPNFSDLVETKETILKVGRRVVKVRI